MANVMGFFLLALFLLPASFLVRLWWQDRLSLGVKITIGVLLAAFISWVAMIDTFWQATAERSWSSYGVFSPVGGAGALDWWRRPAHDLDDFVRASSEAPGGLSYQAYVIVDSGWERRTAWVVAWVIAAMTLWGLKHRKVKLPPVLAYVALVGFFLWAIGREPEVQIEATLGDDDESLMLMQQIGWSDLTPEELLPAEVWQFAAARWRDARQGPRGEPPLDHAQSLALMTLPRPRPLRWQLNLPRTSGGHEHGRFLLHLTEVQGWYLYAHALAHHLRADTEPDAASKAWTYFVRLSGLPPKLLEPLSAGLAEER